MNYKKFVRYYSYSRVSKYYLAANGDKSKAQMLYYANMKVAQSFHPLLSVFEVILRNQLHYALAKYFSDGYWIINQKSGFMIDSSLTYRNKRTKQKVTNNYLLKEVQNAEKRIRNSGKTVTAGRVIAEQTLGFWNSLYEVHHYALLRGVPCTIFNALPKGYGRKEINADIARIRELRNRINHNEPICFVNKKFDCTYEVIISSAHRSPQRTKDYINDAQNRGACVFIAAAGMAAHLAGSIAAQTSKPVIGVPLDSSSLNGLDSLLSTVQMPSGMPVATMAIGKSGAINAAYLAMQILALKNEELSGKLIEDRVIQSKKVELDSNEIEVRII